MHKTTNEASKNVEDYSMLRDNSKSGARRQDRQGLYIPAFLESICPKLITQGLRQFKARLITRGVSSRRLYEQSQDDALAAAAMSIIVPIHDAPAVVWRCLASLENYAQKAEIILVDDGSRMIETRTLITEFSGRNKWTVIRNETPSGHSDASRAGAAVASRPYLCLLNSDTVVTPWCWRLIKEAFERYPAVGVAGPSTSSSGNDQTLPEASRCLAYWNDNQICNFAGSLVSTECQLTDLAWISGFALFIRRTLWQELGGFDRNLPDYGNEVELCRRVAQNGFRGVWVTNAYIHHLGGKSYRQSIGDEGILARIDAAKQYNSNKIVSS